MKVPLPGKVRVHDVEGYWHGDGYLVAAPHPNLEKIQSLTYEPGPWVTTYYLKESGYMGHRITLAHGDRVERISA